MVVEGVPAGPRILTATDLFTGWTENLVVRNGAHKGCPGFIGESLFRTLSPRYPRATLRALGVTLVTGPELRSGWAKPHGLPRV